MKLFIAPTADGKPVGVMVPIPQYPLYSASVAEFGLYQVGYYLDEANNWALDIGELKRAIAASRSRSHPRLIVVINPGNPTGHVTQNSLNHLNFKILSIFHLNYQNIEFVFVFAPGQVLSPEPPKRRRQT